MADSIPVKLLPRMLQVTRRVFILLLNVSPFETSLILYCKKKKVLLCLIKLGYVGFQESQFLKEKWETYLRNYIIFSLE